MVKSTRAALAIGLGLVGAAGFVAQSSGQDGVRQAAVNNAGAARPAAKPASPAVIGTIDMDAVLKNYDKFKVSMETIQAEAMARQGELMKIASEGQAETEKLARLAPGSLDEQKIKAKITELKAKMQAGKESAQAEFSQKDVELLSTMYNEIQKMSGRVAQSKGMNFVVKYSSAPAEKSDPKSVEAALFRSVVFADPAVDITTLVTHYLNLEYKQSGGPAPKGTGVPTAAPATAVSPAAPTQR